MAVSGYLDPAISLLKKTDGAHLYRPGVGWLDNLRAGNYIDSNGNQVAVLDSPVGLTVDALGGLGNTVVVNGSFTTDANWTKGSGWTISNGQAVLTAGGGVLEQVMGSVNVGASYIASINTNLLLQLRIGGVNIGYFAPKNGTILCFIKAITGTLIELVPNGTQTGYVSKISAREITGIHASQNTTADKPVLRRGAVNYVRYSGDFSNGAWTKAGISVSSEEGPTGLIDATRVTVEESATFIAQSSIIARNTVMTAICVLKVTGNNVVIPFLLRNNTTSTSFAFGYFNCATGNITGTGWTSANLVSNNSWRVVTYTRSSGITVGDSLVIYAGATGNSSNIGDYYILHRAAVFAGAYTAAQIQALGGIPLTTTAPASTTFGAYKWDFDATDRLALTLPAGYESATIIDATSEGPVTLLEQDVTGAYGIVGGLTNSGELVTNGDFSNGLDGWSLNANAAGVATVVNGALTYSAPHGDYAEVKQLNKCVVGKTYQVAYEVTVAGVGAQSITISCGRSSIISIAATAFTVGKKTAIIQATHPDGFSISARTDATIAVDNISVKEILPSTHGRIILRDTPTPRQLELCQGLANRLAGL